MIFSGPHLAFISLLILSACRCDTNLNEIEKARHKSPGQFVIRPVNSELVGVMIREPIRNLAAQQSDTDTVHGGVVTRTSYKSLKKGGTDFIVDVVKSGDSLLSVRLTSERYSCEWQLYTEPDVELDFIEVRCSHVLTSWSDCNAIEVVARGEYSVNNFLLALSCSDGECHFGFDGGPIPTSVR